jgi:hypothetical protein
MTKYYKASDGTEQLVIAGGTDWAYATIGVSTTFTSCSLTLSDDKITDFITYDDVLIGFNGVDEPYQWDGTTGAVLTGSKPHASWAPSTMAIYGSRTFSNDASNPNRIYFSGKDNPQDWTSSDTGNIEVGIGDDDYITALVPQPNRLLIFKNNSVWALTGKNADSFAVGTSPLNARLGTAAHRTAVSQDGQVVFIHSSGAEIGVYAIAAGYSQPEVRNLSMPVQKTLNDATSLGFTTGYLNLYKRQLYVGFTPAGGSTNSSAMVLNTDLGAWSTFEFGDSFSSLLTDNKTGTALMYGADEENGFVYLMDNGTQDVGASSTVNITSTYRTKFFDFGTNRISKRISTVWANVSYDRGDEYLFRTVVNGVAGSYSGVGRDTDEGETSEDQVFSSGKLPLQGDKITGVWMALEFEHNTTESFEIYDIEVEASVG